MGLLSGIGSLLGSAGSFLGGILPGIGTAIGLGTNLYGTVKGTQLDEQNLAIQQAENQYQHGIDAWNQQFSTQQFEEQKRLNDRDFNEQSYLNRNAQQIASADAAKAGLNPMAMNGMSMSSGSAGSVGGSNVSSGAQAPQNSGVGISQLSGLAQNMISTAQNAKELKQAKTIADEGNQNARLLAALTDKNNIARLIMECINNGVSPEYLKGVTSHVGDATGSYTFDGIGDYNKEMLFVNSQKKEYEKDNEKLEYDMNDPASLLRAFGLEDEDTTTMVRAVGFLLKLLGK